MMISSMLVFARNFLGTLLREATRVCPAPKAEMCFLRRLRQEISSAGPQPRACCAGNLLLETQTRRAFAVANEAEHRSAAGRGNSTERVTEGEQGKNWRNGARTGTVHRLGRLLSSPDKTWPWHVVKSTSIPASVLFSGDRRMEAETY